MKKIVMFMSSLAMAMVFSATAFAAGFAADAESELSGITDEIVTAVNELYADEIGREITAADVDYDKAYKVYVDTDVFKLATNDAAEIEQALQAGNHIYKVPITTAGGTVVVNVQKGQPLSDNAQSLLTEQEQQEVLSKVGEWVVSVVTFYETGDTRYAYDVSIQKEISEIPEGTMLVGSLPYFQDVVGLIPNDNGEVKSLIPTTALKNEAAVRTYRSASASNVYEYEQIKAYINALPLGDPEMNAGTGGLTSNDPGHLFAASTGAILLCAAALFAIYRKTKTAK
ncbi:MAG: hypothetical protein LBQ15_06020 [Clostridium sp.]|jgi:hypothetical protein|nr:hypothetical protein [Clostridium sp.]